MRRPDAGGVLGLLGTAPAVAATVFTVVGAALPAFGGFRPWLAWPLLLLAVGCGVAVARRLPEVDVPWWAVTGVLVVAGVFTVVAVVGHAEQVLVRRDPAVYALYGHWLAVHGSLPVPASFAPFGGPDPSLANASPGFYAQGASVQPQFVPGLPLLLSLGWWLHGWSGLFAVPAVLGGLAVVAAGWLTARLVGPRWAPLGALAVAVLGPVLHTAQAPYSESAAVLAMLGGLALVVDGTTGDGSRLTAFAGAAVVAGATATRIDALREIVLLVPVVGLLAARGVTSARALAAGLAAGLIAGAAVTAAWARHYAGSLRGSLLPLAALLVLAVAATWVAVRWSRGAAGSLPGRAWSAVSARLPLVVTAVWWLLVAAVAARPLLLTSRTTTADPSVPYVAALQAQLGLPVDGTRTYAEHSATWLLWWVGVPALLLALLGAHLVVRGVLSGRDRRWTAPVVVVLGSTVLTLLRPGITPDHPWADRRLVPVALPGLALLAVAAVAWLVPRVGGRWPRLAVPAAVVLGAAVLVPAVLATRPVADLRTERGERAAGAAACAELRPGDVVLLVDVRARGEWAGWLRTTCDVPTALAYVSTPADLARLTARVRAAGRTAVVVAADAAGSLSALGVPASSVRHVVALDTTEDVRTLVTRPSGAAGRRVDLWLARD